MNSYLLLSNREPERTDFLTSLTVTSPTHSSVLAMVGSTSSLEEQGNKQQNCKKQTFQSDGGTGWQHEHHLHLTLLKMKIEPQWLLWIRENPGLSQGKACQPLWEAVLQILQNAPCWSSSPPNPLSFSVKIHSCAAHKTPDTGQKHIFLLAGGDGNRCQ